MKNFDGKNVQDHISDKTNSKVLNFTRIVTVHTTP